VKSWLFNGFTWVRIGSGFPAGDMGRAGGRDSTTNPMPPIPRTTIGRSRPSQVRTVDRGDGDGSGWLMKTAGNRIRNGSDPEILTPEIGWQQEGPRAKPAQAVQPLRNTPSARHPGSRRACALTVVGEHRNHAG
jgi:hypothetical protein